MRSPSLREFAVIDLTPMLDVVFILLIFFIVTASFVKEPGIEVDRPDTISAQPAKFVSLVVGIGSDDRIWIDRRQVDVREMPTLIEQIHAENPKGGLVIQADARSRSETVLLVLQAARSIGIEPITIAGENPQAAQ